jgi:hypothetical protein
MRANGRMLPAVDDRDSAWAVRNPLGTACIFEWGMVEGAFFKMCVCPRVLMPQRNARRTSLMVGEFTVTHSDMIPGTERTEDVRRFSDRNCRQLGMARVGSHK